MANAISNFTAEIGKRNISRSSRFFVDIPTPPFLSHGVDTEKLLSLFCTQTYFPDMTLVTSQVKVDGLTREVVVDKSYGRVPCIFILDQDMVIKQFFDEWLGNAIVSNGGVFAYPSEYIVDGLAVHQLDLKDNVTYSVTYNQAFPVQMTSIPLDSASKGYSSIQVDFVYKSWTSNAAGTLVKVPSDIANFPASGVVPGVNTINQLRQTTGIAQLGSSNANLVNPSNIYTNQSTDTMMG